MATTQCSSGRN